MDKAKLYKYYVARDLALSNEFSIFEPQYKDIRINLAVNTGNFEDEDRYKKKKIQYYDVNINTLPYKYALTLSTMLLSNFTSPSVRWFSLSLGGKKATREERLYTEDVENVIFDELEDSNLQPSLANVYFEAICYGIGAVLIKKGKNGGIRFQPLTIGEFFIEKDSEGIVNTLDRHFPMTVAQLKDQFGYDNLPELIKRHVRKGDMLQTFTVKHFVEPNNKFLEAYDNPFNKPFTSTYFIKDMGENGILEHKGLGYFPYFVAEWDRWGRCTYPTGIGLTALGDIRMLQAYERDLAKASKKNINPPVIVHTSMKNKEINTGSGAKTYANDMDGIKPLFQFQQNTAEARQNIGALEKRISEYFYHDVFFAMLSSDKTMSATEAAARSAEKIQMLGGLVTRLQKDFLGPLIETVFFLLDEEGKFPEAPESIEGDLEIDYHSLLFQTMDMADLSMVENWLQLVNAMAPTDPSVTLIPDVDAIARKSAIKMGVSEELIRSKDAVANIEAQRQAQAQAARAKEQSEVAVNLGKSAKDFSQADTVSQNALTEMMGAA